MANKCWKKQTGKDIYTNENGGEVGLLKWSPKEYHVLTNTSEGVKKIGMSRNKSGAIRKLKIYIRNHNSC